MRPGWSISLQRQSVPGWPGTFREWWVVYNPHGGIASFDPTRASAERSLEQMARRWRCGCGGPLCRPLGAAS